MKKYKIDHRIKKYCLRFLKMKYPNEVKEINKKAQKLFQQFCNEAPDISQRCNMMASNLYQFITFIAYYEASDQRITKEDIDLVIGWMLDDYKIISKLVDMNKPSVCNLFYKVVKPYAIKVQKKKQQGKWGNTWELQVNPENHDIGFSIHLFGCPLYDFAKTHGYLDILPTMCQIDHDIARLMHTNLIRKGTIAEGSSCCDYWYIGDKYNH